MLNPAQCLPESALLPFTAYRPSAATVVWRNSEGFDWTSVDEYAFCLPLEGEPIETCTPTSKQFYAERYGGHGIGTNGGGARCGLDGLLQIKGIGKNPVAGIGEDFFHTYGGASLNEAIVEALWGEIFHQVLPHGSIRVRALITTGTRVPLVLPELGKDPTTARALIIRDAALRPAHFMRTPHFKPAPDTGPFVDDTVRTQEAIAMLPAVMGSLYGVSDNFVHGFESLNDALIKMATRFGEQIAAARAKRLMHGSLIASNISLNGSWLDFGTSSAVPTWGHIVSPKGPDFLNEELMLHPAIVELSFHLKKYLRLPQCAELHDSKILWDALIKGMNDSLPHEFCKLTGVPTDEIKKISGDVLVRAYEAFKSIMKAGNDRTFYIVSDNSPESYAPVTQTGAYPLIQILRVLANAKNSQDAEIALAGILPSERLRGRLIQTMLAVCNEFLTQYQPNQRETAAEFCRFNALRFTAPLGNFYRPRLYRRVAETIHQNLSVSNLLEELRFCRDKVEMIGLVNAN